MEDTDARVLIVDKIRKRIVLILEKADEVKLPDRTFLKPSKWGFPGGRSEPGDEDAVATAIREVKEEIRMQVFINGRHSVEREADGHTKVLYLGYAEGDLRANKNEILEAGWFSISILHDPSFNMYSTQRKMALELLKKS